LFIKSKKQNLRKVVRWIVLKWHIIKWKKVYKNSSYLQICYKHYKGLTLTWLKCHSCLYLRKIWVLTVYVLYHKNVLNHYNIQLEMTHFLVSGFFSQWYYDNVTNPDLLISLISSSIPVAVNRYMWFSVELGVLSSPSFVLASWYCVTDVTMVSSVTDISRPPFIEDRRPLDVARELKTLRFVVL